ncbi:MAG: restriction endonuclease subunit S [Rhodanobacteraceae bacterium]
MAPRLPNGWAYRELGDLVRIESGGTPSRSNSDYWGEATPWITAKDLKTFDLVDSQERLSDAGAARASVAPKDTVLVLVRGMGLFKDVPIGVTRRPMAFNQDVKALHPNDDVSARFLGHSLQAQRHYLMGKVDMAGHGTGRLPTDVLESLPLPIPSPKEQRRIVAVLDASDRRAHQLNALVRARRQYHEQLVNKLYQSGEGHTKQAKLGSILVESRQDGTHGDVARKLTVKLYGKGVIAKPERLSGSAETQYYVRQAGQLIYSQLDFLNGAIGIIPQGLDGFESTADLPAFGISATVNPVWLLGYLTRRSYYTRRVDIARGQRIARRVKPQDFLDSPIRIPPRSIQDKVATALSTSQGLVELSIHLHDAIEKQKRGLMQKLLTGQWRLARDQTGDLSDREMAHA